MRYELTQAWQWPTHSLAALGLFLISVFTLAYCLTNLVALTPPLIAAILLISLLLALVLLTPTMLRDEIASGYSERLWLERRLLSYIIAKLLVVWGRCVLPLLLVALVLGLMLGLPLSYLPLLAVGFGLTSVAGLALSLCGSTLLYGSSAGSLIAPLLILPLMLPLLLFALAIIDALWRGMGVLPPLAALSGATLIIIITAPALAFAQWRGILAA